MKYRCPFCQSHVEVEDLKFSTTIFCPSCSSVFPANKGSVIEKMEGDLDITAQFGAVEVESSKSFRLNQDKKDETPTSYSLKGQNLRHSVETIFTKVKRPEKEEITIEGEFKEPQPAAQEKRDDIPLDLDFFAPPPKEEAHHKAPEKAFAHESEEEFPTLPKLELLDDIDAMMNIEEKSTSGKKVIDKIDFSALLDEESDLHVSNLWSKDKIQTTAEVKESVVEAEEKPFFVEVPEMDSVDSPFETPMEVEEQVKDRDLRELELDASYKPEPAPLRERPIRATAKMPAVREKKKALDVGRGFKIAIASVLFVAAAGVLLGQTNYGYFGMNLLFPEVFKKYEQAQPLSILERDARFKRDTAASFRAEIEALEAQLKEGQDSEKITLNLIETLFLFKNRFPIEFEKDEKNKSRLAELLKSGTAGKSEITGVLSLMNDGKLDEARAALDAYLVGTSQSVEVLYLYGKIAFEKGNLDEAEKYFRLAYNRNPDYIAPLFFMAQIHVKRGQFPEARQILEKIVSKYPDHNSSRVLLAEVYFNERSIDKSLQLALEAIEKAVADKSLSEEIKSRKIAAKIYGLRNDDKLLLRELENLIKLDDDDEDTVILLAEHYKKINKYDEGYSLLLNCKAKGCKSEKLLSLLLEFSLKLNKDNEAAAFLKEALANFPNSSHFYVIKGTAEQAEGRLKTAIESFGKAIEIDPANTEAYLLLSAAYADEMQYDKALSVLRKGLDSVPSKIQILMEIGTLERLHGNLLKAEESFNKILEMDSENIRAMQQLGLTLYELDKFDQAMKYFERLSEKGAETEETHLAYINALIKMQNLKKAEEELITLLSKNPDSKFGNVLLGYCYTLKKDFKKAEVYIDNSLKVDQNFAAGYYYKGILEAEKNELTKAGDLLMRAVQLEGTNHDYRYKLAEIYFKIGQEDYRQQAKTHLSMIIKDYEREVTAAEKRIKKSPEPFLLRGKIFFIERNYSSALSDFYKAMEIDPSRLDILTDYATALYEAGRYDDSKSYFLQVLSRDRENVQANFYLGMISLKSGVADKAMSYLQVVVKKEPLKYPEAHRKLGFIYKEKGMKPSAEREFTLYLKTQTENTPEKKEVLQILDKM